MMHQDVRDLFDRMYGAWGDADAFAALYREDATVVMPGVFRQGREAVRDSMAAAWAGPLRGSRAIDEPLDVRVLGDTAVVVSRAGILMPGQNELTPGTEVLATWVLTRPRTRGGRSPPTPTPAAADMTSRPIGPSCWCTATGCSGRSTTPRTWCRRRCCAPGAPGTATTPGAAVAAHLALPDRHQRLPDRAGGPGPAAAAVRARRAPSDDPRRAADTGVRHPVAAAVPGRPVPRAGDDPAASVVRRGSLRLALVAALQVLPARQRAVLTPARGAGVLRGRGGRPAGHVGARGQQRAAAGPGGAVRGGGGLGRRARRPRPPGTRSTAMCGRSRSPTSTAWSGCSPTTR